MPGPEEQLYWSASLGLDLANRTVLEAEVLIWRIVRQKSALARSSLNLNENDLVPYALYVSPKAQCPRRLSVVLSGFLDNIVTSEPYSTTVSAAKMVLAETSN